MLIIIVTIPITAANIHKGNAHKVSFITPEKEVYVVLPVKFKDILVIKAEITKLYPIKYKVVGIRK